MNFQELAEYCKKMIQDYPELKHQIHELLVLCYTEIEDGGSTLHEVELCINDIKEIVNDLNGEPK